MDDQNPAEPGKGVKRLGQNRPLPQHLPLLRQIAPGAGAAPGGHDQNRRRRRPFARLCRSLCHGTSVFPLLDRDRDDDNLDEKTGTIDQYLCIARI
jgi:hypothetical protein